MRSTPLHLLLLLCLSLSAFAQDEIQSESTARDNGEAIAAPTQTVEVKVVTRDAEIRQRLTEILEATQRFRQIAVRVENGVVFLEGMTDLADHRQWARELASKTKDVVAVVNNIQVEEGPIFDLTPARREVSALWRQIVQSLPLILIGLALLAVTLLVSRTISAAMSRVLTRGVKSEILRGVVEKAVLLFVVLIGAYVFLRISGLTQIAVTVVGGTGVAGIVLGFAFRDIAENFLASVLISLQRPFRVGDTIEIDGNLGIVQKVTTRGTILMDYEGNHIQLSNALVYKSTIRNLTANPKIRSDFVVGIGYDASIATAQEVALRVCADHPAVIDDPEPLALVESLGAATITMRVYFWINGKTHSILKVRSAIIRLTVRQLEAGGVSMPDEAREVVFPNGVPVRMIESMTADTPAPAQQPRKPVDRREEDDAATPAEGDLSNESADIQRQADASRSPEEGQDILGEAPHTPATKKEGPR